MRRVRLENGRGTIVELADFGATLLAVAPGGGASVVLGPADPERDLAGFPAAGATIGRVANRIAGACFADGGVIRELPANDGAHHLHGGPGGFGRRTWAVDPPGEPAGAATFRFTSPDGDQGYPGGLEVAVTYTLGDDDALAIEYAAAADRRTPVNLTNHAYFNLAGRGDVLGHVLWMDADRWLPIDREIIPTGEVAGVEGTPFDFREPRTLGSRLAALADFGGYDHCLVFREGRDAAAPCIRLADPASGRTLEVVTDQPGVQLYTGNHLDDVTAAGGVRFPRHGGVCLETQHFPDSVHHPQFPSVWLSPGEEFRSLTVLRFGGGSPARASRGAGPGPTSGP